MQKRIDEQNGGDYKSIINTSDIVYNVITMLSFGIGFSLFIIGILYLTTYQYEYSLTVFSVDMMAGLFIATGSILMIITIVRIFLFDPNVQQTMSLVIGILLILFFVLFFILGIIGLSLASNGEFTHEARLNLLTTARKFEEQNVRKHSTKKINWIQRKFNCCGIDSYQDWKSLIVFRNPNIPIQFYEKQQFENRYPYIDDVPDTCCVTPRLNCGKNVNVFGRDRNLIMFTKGCLDIYLKAFSNDIVFICAFATAISVLFLFSGCGLGYVFASKITQKRKRNFEQNKSQRNRLLNKDFSYN